MHLVDDEYAVAPRNGRHEHLVGQRADFIYRIVGGGIHLDDVERALLVERAARFALVARFAVGSQMLTVDCFCENTRSGGLAHSALSAEQVGMRESSALNGILQRIDKGMLPNDAFECCRTVFACRDYVFFHINLMNVTKITKVAGNAKKSRIYILRQTGGMPVVRLGAAIAGLVVLL